MIFIDSDVFLIDLIFKGDKRYNENKNFLSHRLVEKKSTSVFNLKRLRGYRALPILTEALRQKRGLDNLKEAA